MIAPLLLFLAPWTLAADWPPAVPEWTRFKASPGAVASSARAPEASLLAAPSAESAVSPRLLRVSASAVWAWTETYRVASAPIKPEPFLPKNRHQDAEIAAAFGTPEPPSSEFLLHAAPGWDSGSGPVALLVHGSCDNATRAWARPESLLGHPETPGLMQALVKRGWRVFAVTFPNKQGSLFYEAEHVAQALALVRAKTGVAKVTLVGHSAGGLAARVYVSGFRQGPGFTAYQGDVDQLVTLATPHLGQDYIFRHPETNYAFFDRDKPAANSPMSWDKLLHYGVWKDSFDLSVYGPYFPMQRQTLRDWRPEYPANPLSPDGWTTAAGGWGSVSHSLGIREAMARGGDFMERLRRFKVPDDVAVTVFAGTDHRIDGVYTERDGPSDGFVFTKSAACAADMAGPRRTRPIKVRRVPFTHTSIAYAPAMLERLLGALEP